MSKSSLISVAARTVVMAAAMTLSLGAQAGGDAAAGKTRFDSCTGCHGIPGYGNVYPSFRVPKVAGQQEMYLVNALKAYKNGTRFHATMRAQAEGLSDTEIANIAAYLAGLGK